MVVEMDVERFTVHFVIIPDYWENFMHHCNNINPDRAVQLQTVSRELSKWGGVCIRADYEWYLYWDNAAAHTAFVLRWT